MATVTIRSAAVIPFADGNMLGGKVRKIMVADNQTLAAGDFVVLSSGKVAIASTAATSPATDVFGITQDAVANSSTGSTTYVNVKIVSEDTRFLANYCDLSTTSAAVGKVTTTALPGSTASLHKIGTKWVVGISTSYTNKVTLIEEVYPGDSVGDTGGRVVCKIVNSIIE